MSVRALVLTGFGLNCDNETAFALSLAGAEVRRVHINSLIAGEVLLDDVHILALGGGFSWGDDHGAGVIQALKLKNHLGKALADFVAQGKLVIGICNGFQTLVNIGLLPGIDGDYTKRSTALTFNDCGNFRDHWVDMKVDEKSSCVFTKGMDKVCFPIRHGEGKFIADPAVLEHLLQNHQVVLQYADAGGNPAKGKFPENPNGSLADIAGICDPTGRVFGLMPHPEAYNHVTNHPHWTSQKEDANRKGVPLDDSMTIGIILFKNGVDYIREHLL